MRPDEKKIAHKDEYPSKPSDLRRKRKAEGI
jgi:hypothetical protein